ncbi:MAG: type II toxin-antitoxin system RelE/ParE family toxin [Oscillospiraceae bacterium]|jgi:mRNA interferase RelE/StbE|nr:type II toxin-antitoxin system RelE/ParE family toxin [Oscillospiraceae bacterium]
MNTWEVEFTAEAVKDRDALNSSVRNQVYKAIRKVSQNPLPKNEGGYGEPLGNKQGHNLTGLCKIKLLKLGIRVIYKAVRENGVMKIIVIAARADDEVYEIAAKRIDS